MSKASEKYLARSLLCLFELKLKRTYTQKAPHISLLESFWATCHSGGKLWHPFRLSSHFAPGYWLPSLSSKSLKSLFVVTVIPAGCCRLHFDVRDSLQDLEVVKCNCTEPKTKWQIFFLFPPPWSFGLVLIVLVVRATGFMRTCLCSQCHSSLSCVTITAL